MIEKQEFAQDCAFRFAVLGFGDRHAPGIPILSRWLVAVPTSINNNVDFGLGYVTQARIYRTLIGDGVGPPIRATSIPDFSSAADTAARYVFRSSKVDER